MNDNKDLDKILKEDSTCPFKRWLGYDLNQCPGIGEDKCMLQEYEYGEFGGNFDYHPCSVEKYQSCRIYKEKNQKE